MSKFKASNLRDVAPRLFIVAAFFILTNTSALADDHDFSKAKTILDNVIAEEKLAGGVVLVMKDGVEILHYASGMQDIEANIKMEKDSLFRIASQSKAITSVGIMILNKQGKLKFTDPVSKYIPSFAKTNVLRVNEDKTFDIVPAKREITIHDLLTHSSGISYGNAPQQKDWEDAGLWGWYHADKDKPIQDVLAPISTLAHQAQPGEAFVYGHSTDILGAIIEIASGQSFNDFLADEITGPLGMTDTSFYVKGENIKRLSAVYKRTDDVIERSPDAANADSFWFGQGHYVNGPKLAYSGGAGIISTASDYAKLLNMLLGNGTLDGVKILSPESVALMIQDQIPYIDMEWNDGFGYGFQLTKGKDGPHKDKVVQYEWGGAYHSSYYVRPLDGLVVVYLTQLLPTGGLKDWAEINASIREELGIE